MRVRYPINILWSWYYLPTFRNSQNEVPPLTKSNISEPGMSLGPLCILYMYGIYVIQKKTIMLRTISKKKATDLNSANMFAVIFPTPLPPPKEKNNIIGNGKATRWAPTSYKWSYNPTYRTDISPYL